MLHVGIKKINVGSVLKPQTHLAIHNHADHSQDTGINMFDMDQRYNRLIVAPNIAPIEVLIKALVQIDHIHSSVSYQWAIYQRYNRRGCEWQSMFGA